MKTPSLYWLAPLRGFRETLRRLLQNRDGVEAIEFAIVLPVMLVFILGCIEFGRLYWTQSELQYAVEAAARCITVNCSANITGSGPSTYAAKHVYSIAVPAGAIFSVTSPNPACGNQVTVCYPFTFLVPTLFPFRNTAPSTCPVGYTAPTTGLTLTATGCHQA
jgi:Flp pilus assembly protein TadG